jgi:serine/threonine-protein kinase
MSYPLVIEQDKRIDGKSGAFIGRYQIRRELGRGAMGVVYLAEDPAIGRAVAIKTVNFDAVAGGVEETMLLERLVKEARSAGSLAHPGIVTVYDIGQTESTAYIVMEFVEGVTLFDRMREGNLRASEILDWLEQAAQALDFAHSKGILHRDIKPANLMIDTTGRVRIMDFGIARITAQQTMKQTSVLGTPSYMSPEQISNKPISAASDQFSLAVLAYEMLAGKKPFAADSISALLFSIVYQDPAPIEEFNPNLPHALGAALQKGLAKDPAQRYANCRQMVAALRQAMSAAPEAAAVAASSDQTAPTEVLAAPAPTTTVAHKSKAAPSTEPPAASEPLTAPPVALQPEAPDSRTSRRMEEEVERKSHFNPALIGTVGAMAVLIAGIAIWRSSSSSPAPAAPDTPVVSAPKEMPKTAEPAGNAAAVTPPATTVTDAPRPAASATPPAAAASKTTAAALAKLEIYTTPSGASAKIGDNTCTTPCFFDLNPGDHKLTVVLEGFKTENRIVTVSGPREFHLTLRPPAGTLIMSEPAGAVVQVAGKTFTVPFSTQLPAGKHQLEVRDKGRVFTHTVTIEDDTPTAVSFK